ncbi:MAG: aminoacyl-tRNA hydrolase [Ignavibacteriaceae bacterium]|nr:aminoacyl-tRNA hydrolase [Ignavibacteriaceae bacterium]HRI47261.1 aminoacyl-tRNA hydrolase [Ignavibacteriaceae bacterium]
MRSVVGLGNPGKKYNFTRHNAGFLFLDYFAQKHSIQFSPSKYSYFFAKGHVNHAPFLLIKPSTYMNLSGVAIKELMLNDNIDINDILIIYDDVNIPNGDVRVRLTGSDGGHNGVYSIIYNLESDAFARIRVGIGKELNRGEMVDFVLSNFSEEELKQLVDSFNIVAELTEAFILEGSKAMLDVHSRIKKQ